jgi:hypothetical protein
VFCWAGVAAPVQRYLWDLFGTLVVCNPRDWRAPRGSGGGGVRLCTEQAGADIRSEMAVLLGQSPTEPRRSRVSDLGSVTSRSPLDPFVGGSLEDAFCCLIS